MLLATPSHERAIAKELTPTLAIAFTVYKTVFRVRVCLPQYLRFDRHINEEHGSQFAMANSILGKKNSEIYIAYRESVVTIYRTSSFIFLSHENNAIDS